LLHCSRGFFFGWGYMLSGLIVVKRQ